VQFDVSDRDRSVVLTVRDVTHSKVIAESKIPLASLKQRTRAWCKTYKKAAHMGDVLVLINSRL
jgi:hypothetical protein